MRVVRCWTAWVLLLLCLPILSCRTAKDARAAAAQMTGTAQELCAYYAALAHIIDDHAKLERLQKALLGVPLDEQDLAQLKNIYGEMEKRVDMAQSLAKMAEAFSDLSGSKAPADVSQAAAGLGKELSGIQQLPGSSFAPDALQNAGKTLTQLALQHDERRMAASMDATMSALTQMFSREKPAYDSIHRTYIALAQSLALELIKQNQVDPGSLLAPALKPFDLASRMPDKQLPEGLREYAREQVRDQGEEEISAYARASAAMQDALKESASHVHLLATGSRFPANASPPKLSDVESWTKKFQ